jgi:hypothetical protein
VVLSAALAAGCGATRVTTATAIHAGGSVAAFDGGTPRDASPRLATRGDAATDAPRLRLTQEAVAALRARLPGSVGQDTVRRLVGMTETELGGTIDEVGNQLLRYGPIDYTPLERWRRLTTDERWSRLLRTHVAALEEAARRGGLPHRPLELIEEAEVMPLTMLAVSGPALLEFQRRATRYGAREGGIAAGDFEWIRIRDTARWASARLDAIATRLGARPGPAGQRVREVYAPWLLESGREPEAATMLQELERAPGHDAPHWLSIEARALAAAGRDEEAAAALARAPSAQPFETPAERMARLRARAAGIERRTRTGREPAQIRERVWALLLLGRTGEAIDLATNNPSPADPQVLEARAVALAVDGASGDELWRATEDPAGREREGFVAVRIHAGLQRLGPWQFPRRREGGSVAIARAEVVPELRRLLPALRLAAGTPSAPLAWHLELLGLGNAPMGLARAASAQPLLARLDEARAGNDKRVQVLGARLQALLLATSGESARAVESLDGVHPEPELAGDLAGARDLAAALGAILDPSPSRRDRLSAALEARIGAERAGGERGAATVLLYVAHALAHYQAAPASERDGARDELARAVRVSVNLLEERLDAPAERAALLPSLYLQGFLLAPTETEALAYLAHVPSQFASRFGPMLAGVRAHRAGDQEGARTAFERCALDVDDPAVAARCARWLAALGGAARGRWVGEAARLTVQARTLDGAAVAGGTHTPAADIVPLAIEFPQTEIDLETWRLRYTWSAALGWLLAPDAPAR